MAQMEMTYEQPSHIPVLMDETLAALEPKAGDVYVDGTFGAGGHSQAILKAAKCNVIGIDRDPYVETIAERVSKDSRGRLTFIPGRYSQMDTLLEANEIGKVDGVLLDIGVSSMQIDNAERGFSFQKDGPLDMRMSKQGQSAADLVNNMAEEQLAGLIFKYGDERMSRRIARAIVLERVKNPITSTRVLADVIANAVPAYRDDIHPATRSFQALRIAVNNELEELVEGLHAAEKILKPGGRLVVITFHSGEDSIVKDFLRSRARPPSVSRWMPHQQIEFTPTFTLKRSKAIAPSDDEVRENPRARSSKLRVGVRTEHNLA